MSIRPSHLPSLLCIALVWIGASAADQPAVGEAAPAFRLQDQHGEWHALEDFHGRWVALYFYPKDDTPGCTTEACAFRDNIFAFRELDAVILGISLDDVASHKKFAEKYSLPFTLLADSGGETARSYGVLTKIGPIEVAKRQSFLIDPSGTIVRHYDKVDPETHSQQVLADLKSHIAAAP